MSAKLKQLQETRGAKLKEARALLDASHNEKRDLKPEEQSKIDGLHKEIESIDGQINVEVRQISFESGRAPDLSNSEKRDVGNFNLGAALRHCAGVSGVDLSQNDRDILTEGQTESRDSGIGGFKGIMLPRSFVRRENRQAIRAGLGREFRALTATGQTSTTGDQGGMTVQTSPEGLLDGFYNNLVLEEAGVTILEGLKGNVQFPRYVRPTSPTMKTENATADTNQANTAMLALSPLRLPFYIDVSEQLLMQSNVAIETVLKRQVMAQLAEVAQKMLFTGSGTAPQPQGIIGTSGIGAAYAGGANLTSTTNANGAQIVFPDFVNLETIVAVADALQGRPGYITNGKVIGLAKQTKRGLKTPSDTVATDSRFIIDAGANNGGKLEVNGYPIFRSNALPNTYTKGTSTTCSPLIFANWADYFMGFWSGINLEVLRDATLATQGLYRIVASVYFNGGIARTASFAAMTDITA